MSLCTARRIDVKLSKLKVGAGGQIYSGERIATRLDFPNRSQMSFISRVLQCRGRTQKKRYGVLGC